MEIKAAGVLPYAVVNENGKERLYFLLGLNKKRGELEDFGGKREYKCVNGKRVYLESPKQCAIREFYEETYPIFNYEKEVEELFQRTVRTYQFEKSAYQSYVIKIKYDPTIPKRYKTAYKQNIKKPKEGFFEMKSLRWVPSKWVFNRKYRRERSFRLNDILNTLISKFKQKM